MSFKLAKFFSISPFSFDDVEYYEFLFHIEQMIEFKQNNQPKSGIDLRSLMQETS